MSNTITIKESIFVALPPDAVYDFTQDYTKRPEWDRLIKEAKVVSEDPRVVDMVAKDESTMTVRYDKEQRPETTVLTIIEINSQMMKGGEYHWHYQAQDGGTLWTQENTIHLKDALWAKLMLPAAGKYFKDKTVQAMQKAKEMMEMQ